MQIWPNLEQIANFGMLECGLLVIPLPAVDVLTDVLIYLILWMLPPCSTLLCYISRSSGYWNYCMIVLYDRQIQISKRDHLVGQSTSLPASVSRRIVVPALHIGFSVSEQLASSDKSTNICRHILSWTVKWRVFTAMQVWSVLLINWLQPPLQRYCIVSIIFFIAHCKLPIVHCNVVIWFGQPSCWLDVSGCIVLFDFADRGASLALEAPKRFAMLTWLKDCH